MVVKSVAYENVRVGDLIWSKGGYAGKRGHWTRVKEIERDGNTVILKVTDGYSQYGNALEGVGIKRDEE